MGWPVAAPAPWSMSLPAYGNGVGRLVALSTTSPSARRTSRRWLKQVGDDVAVDEPLLELGRSLKLPPWLEPNRAQIAAALPPLQLDMDIP